MRNILYLTLAIVFVLVASCGEDNTPTPTPIPDVEPVDVTKTNDTKIYMHYMPWFDTPEFSGDWSSHWRMANKNPDNFLSNGNRQIASHYYPLIGPYDSEDRDVIDYHLLLMKYAGVDGILIDWYGKYDVADYKSNLDNSNAIINRLEDIGLEYAIVYEEFTAEFVANATNNTDIQAAQGDMTYMESRYFSDDYYIHIDGNPLLLTFGPRYFNNTAQWNDILSVLNQEITFMPLWNFTNKVGANNADGEFAWIDFTPSYSELQSFYATSNSQIVMGAVFPGYHDYYVEGNWGTSYGFVDHNNGITLDATLQKAAQADLDYIQLCTFNDFGEGTIFEPTQEFEYQYLEKVQDFTGVTYEKAAFETIHTYYLKRKEHAGNVENQKVLNEVFDALVQLDLDTANTLLSGL